MDATSHAVGEAVTGENAAAASGGTAGATAGATATAPRFADAGFPWYGLDDAWTGRRWFGTVGTSPDGRVVDYGSLGHGDEPVRSYLAQDPSEGRRFAVVVTVAGRTARRLDDGTGMLEATSIASAAWLAGSGLLAATEHAPMERTLRQDWLDQQTTLAWDLADDIDGPAWSSLTLPVNGTPQAFRYRESEYGWVLAGDAPGVHLGAYGRGVSAYGLGFTTVTDLASYEQ
ncbi:hypothetical protein [Streptacidiphilus fuscans]|uniref:Uncharacterized protein n=1 Tax=Streptacidiphilus fuscans TaxID=2789292 RepID=A0A931FBN8_9ACTN|nr:hypothetical protein [Streptacidiphilus fuscans]MBF9067638.1 hypothetical protein [Streptacidiphilus fuscans]